MPGMILHSQKFMVCLGAVPPGRAAEEPNLGSGMALRSAAWPAKRTSWDPPEHTSQGKNNQSRRSPGRPPLKRKLKVYHT